MTRNEKIHARLAVIKSKLVIAHRAKDWETSKLLSREKAILKKRIRRECLTCGFPVGHKNTSGYCRCCHPRLLSIKATRWVGNIRPQTDASAVREQCDDDAN